MYIQNPQQTNYIHVECLYYYPAIYIHVECLYYYPAVYIHVDYVLLPCCVRLSNWEMAVWFTCMKHAAAINDQVSSYLGHGKINSR